jgi:hypothetical protein
MGIVHYPADNNEPMHDEALHDDENLKNPATAPDIPAGGEIEHQTDV